ncbi:MAG TPA: hypothetical protein VFP35_02045 [Candidatus Saccharimonadales bacterium]|nr:hypothetical protein [Candidatus Saccharimonadales bacterium]
MVPNDNSTQTTPSLPLTQDGADQAPAQNPISASGVEPAGDNLLDIKKQALQNLAPLINQLELAPPEKFKTLMMLIQASDNPALIKDAYHAANQISDNKAKAQALIDVVNEINYFTKNQK